MKVERMDVFRYYKKDQNYAFEGHRHEGYEVNILLQGEMKVTCDRQMFHLHAGELLCFSADSFHRNRVLCDNTIFISLRFKGEPSLREATVYTLGVSDLALVGVLVDEAGDSENGRITAAGTALLQALLLRVTRSAQKSGFVVDDTAELYRRAVCIMEEHICEQVSVPEIAHKCGVCLTTLKNAFAVCTGKGVGTFYNEMKMERARGLISNGASITETADILGYSSVAYFCQAFKQHHGQSATAWKKKDEMGESSAS